MLIAAPVNSQLATAAVRRAIQAGNSIIAAPAAVATVSAISAEGSASTGGELLKQLAGRVLPAVVLARLDHTQGIVDIAGERYSVAARLPDNGRALMLRFAGSVNGSNAAAGGSPAAGAAGVANAALGNSVLTASAAPERAAQVVLGALARQLSDVASSDARPLTLGPVAASVQSAPAFAAALSALVRDSGMFYESHVARWSRGQYPLTQLKREPQAVSASAAGNSPAAGVLPGLDQVARVSIGAPPAPALVAAELQPIVREQLDMLEQRGLSVTIEAWPGQAAQLEIRQPIDFDWEPQSTPEAGENAAAWSTRLVLELPHLGRLEAQIGLAGDRLQLVIHAAPAVASQLGARTSLLSEALAGAGIALTGLRIQP